MKDRNTIERLTNPDGHFVTLYKHDDGAEDPAYFMHGPSGNHTLDCANTDAERLAAHWAGFCQMNDCSNRAMVEAKADPKKVASSHAVELDVVRSRYLVGLVEARIESLEHFAGRLDADWGHAGDAEHLRQQLLAICAPDDDGSLLAEIDAEINGEDDNDELGLAEFDRVQTS